MLVPSGKVHHSIFFNTDMVPLTAEAQKRGAIGDASFIIGSIFRKTDTFCSSQCNLSSNDSLRKEVNSIFTYNLA